LFDGLKVRIVMIFADYLIVKVKEKRRVDGMFINCIEPMIYIRFCLKKSGHSVVLSWVNE